MKRMKFSGREIAVLRAIDFTTGSTGDEVMERTCIDPADLLEIINGLLDVGYIETNPPAESVTAEQLLATLFEVNPAYVHDLRAATVRR